MSNCASRYERLSGTSGRRRGLLSLPHCCHFHKTCPMCFAPPFVGELGHTPLARLPCRAVAKGFRRASGIPMTDGCNPDVNAHGCTHVNLPPPPSRPKAPDLHLFPPQICGYSCQRPKLDGRSIKCFPWWNLSPPFAMGWSIGAVVCVVGGERQGGVSWKESKLDQNCEEM